MSVWIFCRIKRKMVQHKGLQRLRATQRCVKRVVEMKKQIQIWRKAIELLVQKEKKCIRYDATRKKCENANLPMCYAGHRKNSKFEADQNHNGVLPHEISSARWTLAFHRIRRPFQHLPRSLEFVRMHGFPPHSRVIWILERPKIAWKIPKESLCSYRSNSSVSL